MRDEGKLVLILVQLQGKVLADVRLSYEGDYEWGGGGVMEEAIKTTQHIIRTCYLCFCKYLYCKSLSHC